MHYRIKAIIFGLMRLGGSYRPCSRRSEEDNRPIESEVRMQFNLYWPATVLLVLLYLVSVATYVAKWNWVRGTIVGFGYPAYLVPVLVAAKLLAVAAVTARASVALSDLAYAGMLFHLLLSAGAHLGIRKAAGAAPAILGLALLFTSFATQNSARNPPSPYAPAKLIG